MAAKINLNRLKLGVHITRYRDNFKSSCKLKHHHSIEMPENLHHIIQLHGTFKHKMMRVHCNVSLFTQHHFIW